MTTKIEVKKPKQQQKLSAKEKEPRKRFTPDPTGKLGVAKSIAARFGEEICEDEFFDEP